MNCCNKIYRVCEAINPCDLQSLADALAEFLTVDGTYTLKLDFLGICKVYTVEKVADVVTIEGDLLNESFIYTGELFNAANEKVLIATDHDCLTFKTVICLSTL